MSVQLSTFDARGIDEAASIRLSFTRPEDGIIPTDIWSGRLEVWRSEFDYPVRGQLGASLDFLDHSGLGPNDPIPDFDVLSLIPGVEYYYAVYVEDQDGNWYHDPEDRAHTFPWPSTFDHSTFVYTKLIDGAVQKRDADNDLVLQRIIQLLIGEPTDSFKTAAEKLASFRSIDDIPGDQIIESDALYGWPTATHRPFRFQREESRNIRSLMERKGLRSVIETSLLTASQHLPEVVDGVRYQFFLNGSLTIQNSDAVKPNIDLPTDVVRYLPDPDKWQRTNALAAFLSPIPDISQGIDELFYADLVRLFGSHNRDSTGKSQLLPSNIDLFVNVTNWGTLQNIVLAPVPPVQNSASLFTDNFDSYSAGSIGGQGSWVAPAVEPDPLTVSTTQARSGANSLGAVVPATDAWDAAMDVGIIGFRYYVFEFYVYIPSGQTEELTIGSPFTAGWISLAPLGGLPHDRFLVLPDRIIWALDLVATSLDDLGETTFLLASDYDTWLYVRMDYDTKLGVKSCYFRNLNRPQFAVVNAQKNVAQSGLAPPWTEAGGAFLYSKITGGPTQSMEIYFDDITITGVS